MLHYYALVRPASNVHIYMINQLFIIYNEPIIWVRFTNEPESIIFLYIEKHLTWHQNVKNLFDPQYKNVFLQKLIIVQRGEIRIIHNNKYHYEIDPLSKENGGQIKAACIGKHMHTTMWHQYRLDTKTRPRTRALLRLERTMNLLCH